MNNNIIKYNISKCGSVTVKVVDIIGTPVRFILNNHSEPGSYELSLDAEHLPPGKYYYKILYKDPLIYGPDDDDETEGETIESGQVKIGL